jgi:hypothetical protein
MQDTLEQVYKLASLALEISKTSPKKSVAFILRFLQAWKRSNYDNSVALRIFDEWVIQQT